MQWWCMNKDLIAGYVMLWYRQPTTGMLTWRLRRYGDLLLWVASCWYKPCMTRIGPPEQVRWRWLEALRIVVNRKWKINTLDSSRRQTKGRDLFTPSRNCSPDTSHDTACSVWICAALLWFAINDWQFALQSSEWWIQMNVICTTRLTAIILLWQCGS